MILFDDRRLSLLGTSAPELRQSPRGPRAVLSPKQSVLDPHSLPFAWTRCSSAFNLRSLAITVCPPSMLPFALLSNWPKLINEAYFIKVNNKLARTIKATTSRDGRTLKPCFIGRIRIGWLPYDESAYESWVAIRVGVRVFHFVSQFDAHFDVHFNAHFDSHFEPHLDLELHLEPSIWNCI